MEIIYGSYAQHSPLRKVYADRHTIMRLCRVSRRTAFRVLRENACAVIIDPVTHKRHKVIYMNLLLVYDWRSGGTTFKVPRKPRGNPHFKESEYQRELAQRIRIR